MCKILNLNRRYYPTQMGAKGIERIRNSGFFGFADEPPCVMTVLVEGDIGDYAAYTAITDDPEWAARNGDKLSFAEAQIHFPLGLKQELYRA